MNIRPKKSAEEMRKYKLDWYHAHKELSGERKNQNTYKTHCIRGHELSGDNLVVKKTNSGETHRICRTCRNTDARETARVAEAKYRAFKKSDPVKWEEERRRRRAAQLRSIGWTLEMYEQRFSEQEGKCAICKKVLSKTCVGSIKEDQANADHEHTRPPKPREILCNNCNLGIGNLQEDPVILKAALAYLEKWKEG